MLLNLYFSRIVLWRVVTVTQTAFANARRPFTALAAFLAAVLLCASVVCLPERAQAVTAESVTLSDEQGLAFAAELMEQNQNAEARRVYTLLLQSKKTTVKTEAEFMLAMLAVAEREYDKAIGLLISSLNRDPSLARVRLELARTYFLNENYDDARFHFELVKGGKDIPPEVVANIDLFLNAIRRQKNWSLEFALGIVPDSNINQASGNNEECIGTIFGLLCRELESKKTGNGGRLNVTGNYYLKLSKQFGIKNTAGVYLTEYDGRDYDDYILYMASGPRVLFGKAEASLQPVYMKRFVAGDTYSDSYGVRFDLQNDFGRLLLATGGAATKNTYATGYVDTALRGWEYRAYLQPRFIVSNRSFVQAGLEYTRDETGIDIYGSDTWRYSAGWYYSFKYGFSLFLEGSLSDVTYHAPQYYITRDHRIDRTRRRDFIQGVSAELGLNLWEGKGIRPSLHYSYTKRDSNIYSREYDRHRINLMLSLRF